jgi:hypothetical protein
MSTGPISGIEDRQVEVAETMRIARRWTDVVRASRPLWHGHPARARERDAPARPRARRPRHDFQGRK